MGYVIRAIALNDLSQMIEKIQQWTRADTLNTVFKNTFLHNVWEKVFKNWPSKICGRPSLKKLKRYGLLKQTIFL